MKTIGFPINDKENENRRAILPNDLNGLEDICKYLYFEVGYGLVLGIEDVEYKNLGCNVVDKSAVLSCDIIIDPKLGDASYLSLLKNKILFGWIHATQNYNIAKTIVDNKCTAIAWEKMNENNRHCFWKNNELAGEAAIMHAFQCYGKMPYNLNVAILGQGNTARGAIKVLNMLGASVTQYNRRTEKLFRDEISNYDVIINCILWDVYRTDHILYKEDLVRMKKNALIIDVSCDRNGGIETSIPTTIENPTYYVDGIMHYVVDHTPAIFYKTFVENNSKIIAQYLRQLLESNYSKVIEDAIIIKNGIVIDEEIIRFQKVKNGIDFYTGK